MFNYSSVALTLLAGACFVLGTIAVAIPFWGHFRNRVIQETGHFGPWTICRDIDYGREVCGQRIVMFRPLFQVYAAGVCAAVGVAALGAYGLMSILYMTIRCSPHSTLRRHKVAILITKLILAHVAALASYASVGLFATQGDDLEHGYILTLGFSFVMEIVVAVFSTILVLLTISEYVAVRREPEDEVEAAGTEIGLKNIGGRLSSPSNGEVLICKTKRSVGSSTAEFEDMDPILRSHGKSERKVQRHGKPRSLGIIKKPR